MVKIKIDLQNDPLIPRGHALMRQLVGAHLSASDDEELLHMVGVALGDVHSSNIDEAMRILTHAAYHAQELIMRLLDTAAERGVALFSDATGSHKDSVTEERMNLWLDLKREFE